MNPFLVVLLLLAAPVAITPDVGAQGRDDALARVAPGVHESLEDGPAVVYLTHVRSADPEAARADLEALGLDHVLLPRIGVTQVVADRADMEQLRGLPWVSSLHPDRAIEFALDDAVPLANVTGAWEDQGARGREVVILVIDSGVDALHPDLEGRVLESAEPAEPLDTGLVPWDYREGLPFNDVAGHGTLMAGVATGTGEGLGQVDPSHGKYVGVAPEADIVSWGIRPGGSFLAQALQGFEYALENHERFEIRVISNSWGGWGGAHDPEDPINVASLEAYKAGMALAFAAGNTGEPEACDEVWINSFGNMPWALTVGATDKEAALTSFSSRGMDPRVCGEVWTHPTVVAPGASIMAAKSRGGTAQALDIVLQMGPEPMERDHVAFATHYQYASGTSMSTPMVAGILALMFEANPELSPAQAYDILVESAVALAEDRPYWQAGAGMVDAGAAVERALATNGELEAFLAGDQPYTDWEDPLDEPLRRFVVAQAPEHIEAAVLIAFLGTEGLLAQDEGIVPLADDGVRGVPAAGMSIIVGGLLLAALAGRRRP